jgi:hypothetical protein
MKNIKVTIEEIIHTKRENVSIDLCELANSKYINQLFDINHGNCKIILCSLNIYDNVNFLIETVLKYPNYEWNYFFLSHHVNFSFDIICDHMELDWSRNMFSCNPNINIDIMMDNPEIKWDYKEYSNDINIDWEQIMDYSWVKHNFTNITGNDFNQDPLYRGVNLRRQLFDIEIILEYRIVVNELV